MKVQMQRALVPELGEVLNNLRLNGTLITNRSLPRFTQFNSDLASRLLWLEGVALLTLIVLVYKLLMLHEKTNNF
jgi:hypothetical protein